MPRLRSPPLVRKATPSDDEEEEGENYEESFESFSSPTIKHNGMKPSEPNDSANRVETPGVVSGNEDKTEEPTESEPLLPNKSSLSNSASSKSLEGMDLETFMKNASVRKGGDSDNASNANDPSMRPLDGVSPNKNPIDRALGLKLGYNELEEQEQEQEQEHDQSAETAKVKSDVKQKKRAMFQVPDEDDEEDRTNKENVRARKGKPQGVSFPDNDPNEQLAGLGEMKTKLKGVMVGRADAKVPPAGTSKGPISSEQYAYYASLLNRKATDVDENGLSKGSQNSAVPSDEDSARRVDALLNELIPHRAIKAQSTASQAQSQVKPNAPNQLQRKLKQPALQSSVSDSSQYGLAAIPSKRSHHFDGDDSEADMRFQQSLESQIAVLKKDMRARDDRLSRLTEHSMMLSNHCDNLKTELAQMQNKLRSAELELEAKEQRASDAARLRKKAMKKSAKLAAEMENYDTLVQTCERLQTREQALLEAVEALSTQNEDLIKKLKASMGRELELSQKQAKLAQASSLLEEPISPQSPPRAQTDTRLSRYKAGRRGDGRLLPDLGGGGASKRY